jgi:hypothetical protein
MLEDEVWHVIHEFPSYMISNYGRVKKTDSVNARQIAVNERGFPIIVLFGKGGGESKTRYLRQINKLVAEAFLELPAYPDETSVWHIDGNLENCRADNLKWETRSRVLEWNEMNRKKDPQYNTGPVRNTRTGKEYENAFECAMDEGRIESDIVIRADKGSPRYEWI